MVLRLWSAPTDDTDTARANAEEKKETEWEMPPTPSGDGDERPIVVELQLELNHVSNVDTVNSTANVKFGVVMWWIDERIKELNLGRGGTLPKNMWGPKLRVHNGIDLAERQIVFDVEDMDRCKIKRLITYTGTVENAMQLEDFPFDLDDLDIILRTSSDFMTKDGEISGALPAGQIYRLIWKQGAKEQFPNATKKFRRNDLKKASGRPPCGALGNWRCAHPEADSDAFNRANDELEKIQVHPLGLGETCMPLRLRWNCALHEWIVLGISIKGWTELGRDMASSQGTSREESFVPPELKAKWSTRSVIHVNEHSYTPTTIQMSIHIARDWTYYLWRALLPLIFTFGLAMSAFFIDAKELNDRLEVVITSFLATVGLMYVMTTFLPKTSTFTSMDKVTVATIVALVFTGLEVTYVAWELDERNQVKDSELSQLVDRITFWTLIGLYTLIILITMVPPFFRRRKAWNHHFQQRNGISHSGHLVFIKDDMRSSIVAKHSESTLCETDTCWGGDCGDDKPCGDHKIAIPPTLLWEKEADFVMAERCKAIVDAERRATNLHML